METPDQTSLKKQRNAKIRRDKCKKGTKHNSHNSLHKSNVPAQPHKSEEKETVLEDKPLEEKENVVDHSHLKRETDEIAKLTKSFSKREITSNWYRFAASGSNMPQDNVESDSPADFSALLQVPSSRGGHLQLKDEQGWSSESYKNQWALDLKRLSFGLACIPTHERLRLPQDKLTKEEIQRYNSLADEANKCYNANIGEHNKDDIYVKEMPFNILDVEQSTNALINMNIEMNDTTIKNNISKEQLVKDSTNKEAELKNKYKENNRLEIEKSFADLPIPSNENTLKPELKDNLVNNINNVTHNVNVTERDIPLVEDIGHDVCTYDIKDQRPNKTSRRKTPINDGVNKMPVSVDNVQLEEEEEDEELNFLLSLQNPVKSENKVRESKDSSRPPGGGKSQSATISIQPSDLDDWLDSVLQD